MTIIKQMIDFLKICVIALFLIVLLIYLFIGGFLVLLTEIQNNPPYEDYYKKSLEFTINDTLSSCKVIKQKYGEEQYAMAIIKLSESDYKKVLNKIKFDSIFKSITNPDWPDSEMSKLMKKVNIIPQNISFKYEKYYSEKWGFIPPNIIIFDKDLH